LFAKASGSLAARRKIPLPAAISYGICLQKAEAFLYKAVIPELHEQPGQAYTLYHKSSAAHSPD
jgi:hypothetical protein